MDVKSGFKQSELGIFPAQWKIFELGELNPFITSGSRGWARYYSDRGSVFLRITNLSRRSIYPDLSDLKYVRIPANDTEGLRTQLREGDVLVSITADIGIIGYVDRSIPLPTYINQHIALARFEQSQVNSKFLSYFLASTGPQRLFRATTDQGAKAGLSLTGVRRIKAVSPPLPEQKAIAKALSDADALIESLKQLIAKKRQIKQGAVQELLTGARRLPGFTTIDEYRQTELGSIPKDWRVYSLAKICSMRSGESITSVRIDSHSAYPCYGCNGQRGFTERYTHNGRYALIGRQGALCGNVLGVDGKFFASEHAIVVTASTQTDIRWLTFVMQEMRLNRYSESSAQPGLSVLKLLCLNVVCPAIKEEQAAIAVVLSDMEAEITSLEAKLTAALQIRVGMMQELLTGRIRLV